MCIVSIHAYNTLYDNIMNKFILFIIHIALYSIYCMKSSYVQFLLFIYTIIFICSVLIVYIYEHLHMFSSYCSLYESHTNHYILRTIRTSSYVQFLLFIYQLFVHHLMFSSYCSYINNSYFISCSVRICCFLSFWVFTTGIQLNYLFPYVVGNIWFVLKSVMQTCTFFGKFSYVVLRINFFINFMLNWSIVTYLGLQHDLLKGDLLQRRRSCDGRRRRCRGSFSWPQCSLVVEGSH